MDLNPAVWEILLTLLRISRTIRRDLENKLRPRGLGLTDFKLMAFLYSLRNPSQKELAHHLGLSQVVVSVRLAHLEENGWVERTAVDRRMVAVQLTPSGVDQLKTLIAWISESNSIRKLGMLASDEQLRSGETMRRLMTVLDLVPPDAAMDAKCAEIDDLIKALLDLKVGGTGPP